MMQRILIVDDERDIAELISDTLIDEGYDTVIKTSGEDALSEIESNPSFDLILLDIMMPGMSGTELCNKVRDKVKCPIIFVSAKSSTVDKLLGFELGADDYIAKPFDIYELVARVKAHLRREDRSKIIVDDNILEIGEIKVVKESYETYVNNKKIDISTREFEVLYYLMKNAGIVLTKEQIFDSVWGKDYGDLGTVAVHIKSLRNKIDKDEKYIKTIWGVGYKFIKVIDND
ncbi:MAG: response regulator transcription factor [Bacilli bacterium]|nr:response regulator transcription factor [Bacilli bacterium]MBQ8871940.1 response regulator transcription factor [Bacilli bacterium]